MRNVPLWADVWRCFNVILGGVLSGLFIRYLYCLVKKTPVSYVVHFSVPAAIVFLVLALAAGSIASIHIGVGLTVAVPLCTLGEVVGIRGMLDLVALRKDSNKSS